MDAIPSSAKVETEVANEVSVALTDVYSFHLLLHSVALQHKASLSCLF